MAADNANALESCGGGVWRMPGACIVDRSGERKLPIGFGDFDGVITRSVFVDKTALIADLIDSGYAVTLFCRPRRFGKTLNMTMMKSFFEIPVDGVNRAPMFEGLDVWEAADGRYRQHQGAYPVISLSMLTAKGMTWRQSYGALVNAIAGEYARHRYLLEDETLPDTDRDYFARIESLRASEADYLDSLKRLVVMLHRHHRRPVALLIDEYDAPIMAAYSAPDGGYYDEAVSFIKPWLTAALKNNENMLAFACLTGVQRISKESIFSDLNNLTVNTALSTDFDEHYGFTAQEVRALGEYLGQRDFMDEARQWYDGYRFGKQDVYNPWSILNYFDQGCEPDVYWGNTSGNGVVGELIRNADAGTLDKVYALMSPDGEISAPLDLSLVFPDLGVKRDAIWSMLYLSGYLTTDDVSRPGRTDLLRRLRIPDLEIAFLYQSEIIERFAATAGSRDRLSDFHQALCEGDADVVRDELGRILRDSTSGFDMVSENSLHMLMTGLCFGVPGYDNPLSNKEAGYGRYDLRLNPSSDGVAGFSFVAPKVRPLITIELKFLHDAAALPADALDVALRDKARQALDQITQRGYDDGPLPRNAQGRLRWGIAVGARHCAVAVERLA